MKLVKKLLGNTLMLIVSVVIITLILSILTQALTLGFYALLLVFGLGALVYLLLRSPN